jgi:hypothetical protein
MFQDITDKIIKGSVDDQNRLPASEFHGNVGYTSTVLPIINTFPTCGVDSPPNPEVIMCRPVLHARAQDRKRQCIYIGQ